MFERLQKLLDRVESRIALLSIIGGGSVVGWITAQLSQGVAWISQFGWFGWWAAFCAGLIGTSIFALCTLQARRAWVFASAQKKWALNVDTFNPMDRDFRNLRVRLSDVAHPLTKQISGKRFYDCELIGPANVFMYKNLNMNGVGFFDCNIVVLKLDNQGNVNPGNAIVMVDTEMHSCKVYGATIIIPPSLVQTFYDMGAVFSTLTGDEKIDSL